MMIVFSFLPVGKDTPLSRAFFFFSAVVFFPQSEQHKGLTQTPADGFSSTLPLFLPF